jgi:hypothetical protein
MRKVLLAVSLATVLTAPAQAGWLDFLKADTYPLREVGPERTKFLGAEVKGCFRDLSDSHPTWPYSKKLEACYCSAEFLADNVTAKMAKEALGTDGRLNVTPATRALVEKGMAYVAGCHLNIGQDASGSIASQMRTAFASMVENTGSSSPGEPEMTCSTSEVAVCCSKASLRSSVRCRSSLSRRVFSMAMTAWRAKFFTSSICLSVNGRTSWR